HDGELRLADHASQDGRVEGGAEEGHDGNGQRERGPVADAVPDDEHVTGERAEHEEIALGEVDELGRLVDEDEAEGHQAVDAPDGQAVQHQLENRVHSLSYAPSDMGGPKWPPIPPTRSGRPGQAVAPLDIATGSSDARVTAAALPRPRRAPCGAGCSPRTGGRPDCSPPGATRAAAAGPPPAARPRPRSARRPACRSSGGWPPRRRTRRARILRH